MSKVREQNILNRLDEIQRDLSWIIKYMLERDKPVVPPPFNPGLNSSFRCPTCNIDFSKAMGYVCQNPKCPVMPQVTSTSNGINT